MTNEPHNDEPHNLPDSQRLAQLPPQPTGSARHDLHHDPSSEPLSDPYPESDSDHPTPGTDITRFALSALAMLMLLLGALASFPWVYAIANERWAPKAREDLGVVQKVSYFGSWGVHTQIDTVSDAVGASVENIEGHTFLLAGAVSMDKGVRLQRRERLLDFAVCIAETEVCYELRSR
jgi:hypothetical protein